MQREKYEYKIHEAITAGYVLLECVTILNQDNINAKMRVGADIITNSIQYRRIRCTTHCSRVPIRYMKLLLADMHFYDL